MKRNYYSDWAKYPSDLPQDRIVEAKITMESWRAGKNGKRDVAFPKQATFHLFQNMPNFIALKKQKI